MIDFFRVVIENIKTSMSGANRGIGWREGDEDEADGGAINSVVVASRIDAGCGGVFYLRIGRTFQIR